MNRTLRYVLLSVILFFIALFVAPFIAERVPFKYPLVLSRCIQVAFVLILLVYFRNTKFKLKALLDAADVRFDSAGKKILIKGFLFGLICIVLSAFFELVIGARDSTRIEYGFPLVYGIAKALVTGFVVAFIEEIFFRGIIFKWLAKKKGVLFGIIVSSAIYASLHFFQSPRIEVSANPTLFDGLRVVFGFLHTVANPLPVLPAFVGLFIFGAILAYVYHRTGNIMLAMGVHAGAVFALKTNAKWTRIVWENPELRVSPIIGSKVMYDGVVGWCFLILLFIALKWYLDQSHQAHVRD